MNAGLVSQIGERVGPFVLRRALGAGAYGAVFEAESEDARRVALKLIIPQNDAQHEELTLRFLREVEVVQKLDHPNIIKLIEYGQSEQGVLWAAFELLRGETLQSLVDREQRLAPQRVFCLILQVLDGLAYAHQRGIVHRDIKPANIMLLPGEPPRIKVLDFGVGKVLTGGDNPTLQNLTERIGGVFGTPRYIAPEVLKGQGARAATDVYAVALILLELLSGKPAFGGNTVYDILRAHAKDGLCLPEALSGTALGDLLLRCAAKDPAQRPSDAGQFRDLLAAIVRTEAVTSPAPQSSAGLASEPCATTEAGEALVGSVPESERMSREAAESMPSANASAAVQSAEASPALRLCVGLAEHLPSSIETPQSPSALEADLESSTAPCSKTKQAELPRPLRPCASARDSTESRPAPGWESSVIGFLLCSVGMLLLLGWSAC